MTVAAQGKAPGQTLRSDVRVAGTANLPAAVTRGSDDAFERGRKGS